MKKQQTETPFPDPPSHLSERSRDLWRQLGPRHARSIQRRTLFQSGLEALDRADEARRVLEAEGLVLKTATTGVSHLHPAAKLEREARQQFCRIWDMLNLTFSYEIDSQKGD